jgi:hypothetical protein
MFYFLLCGEMVSEGGHEISMQLGIPQCAIDWIRGSKGMALPQAVGIRFKENRVMKSSLELVMLYNSNLPPKIPF